MKAKEIDQLQNRAIRYFLGVHKFAANAAIVGDMGWLQPKYSRYLQCIRFWNRLINMENGRLTKKIFLWDYECNNNWNTEMASLFDKLQLREVHGNKHICDVNIASDKINDLMQSNWKKEAENKPKLRTFVLYKHEISPELYCCRIINRQRRAIFAQFRSGILPLKIETGRFRKLKVEERLCEMCDLNKIEDEQHFLCECPKYSGLRLPLLRKAREQIALFDTLDPQGQFISLVTIMWREVSFFLEDAWNVRKSELYQ